MAFKSEKGFKEGIEEANLMQRIGLEIKILNGGEIQELEPNARTDITGGVFYPQDVHLIPA